VTCLIAAGERYLNQSWQSVFRLHALRQLGQSHPECLRENGQATQAWLSGVFPASPVRGIHTLHSVYGRQSCLPVRGLFPSRAHVGIQAAEPAQKRAFVLRVMAWRRAQHFQFASTAWFREAAKQKSDRKVWIDALLDQQPAQLVERQCAGPRLVQPTSQVSVLVDSSQAVR
jgi:hypothetical protein